MPARDWINKSDVAEMLGVSPDAVNRIVPAANIRRRVIPGARIKYFRPDVERVNRESVVGGVEAGAELVGAK